MRLPWRGPSEWCGVLLELADHRDRRGPHRSPCAPGRGQLRRRGRRPGTSGPRRTVAGHCGSINTPDGAAAAQRPGAASSGSGRPPCGSRRCSDVSTAHLRRRIGRPRRVFLSTSTWRSSRFLSVSSVGLLAYQHCKQYRCLVLTLKHPEQSGSVGERRTTSPRWHRRATGAPWNYAHRYALPPAHDETGSSRGGRSALAHHRRAPRPGQSTIQGARIIVRLLPATTISLTCCGSDFDCPDGVPQAHTHSASDDLASAAAPEPAGLGPA